MADGSDIIDSFPEEEYVEQSHGVYGYLIVPKKLLQKLGHEIWIKNSVFRYSLLSISTIQGSLSSYKNTIDDRFADLVDMTAGCIDLALVQVLQYG